MARQVLRGHLVSIGYFTVSAISILTSFYCDTMYIETLLKLLNWLSNRSYTAQPALKLNCACADVTVTSTHWRSGGNWSAIYSGVRPSVCLSVCVSGDRCSCCRCWLEQKIADCNTKPLGDSFHHDRPSLTTSDILLSNFLNGLSNYRVVV